MEALIFDAMADCILEADPARLLETRKKMAPMVIEETQVLNLAEVSSHLRVF
jgi:hypothetical protein